MECCRNTSKKLLLSYNIKFEEHHLGGISYNMNKLIIILYSFGQNIRQTIMTLVTSICFA